MTLHIGIADAGLIGRRHSDAVAPVPGVSVAGIADPATGQDIAARHAAPHFDTLDAMIAVVRPDSIILATPNARHLPGTLTCYLIGGTQGSLSPPDLTLWSHPGPRSWWEPFSATTLIHGFDDPMVQQIVQFAEVIAGRAAPLVSARDGLQTQAVIETVKTSACTGTTTDL